ncbi:MAG: 4-oxalocrotonate tautomerase family protein [Desulfuromonadales bacterium]|nr:4-oxalocrotonate tautomerase family protein [Desulfuromonadales bacterium]
MPVIIVRTVEGVTTQQKEQLIEQFTKTMKDVLGKNPETTHIVIEEVPAENWGIRGRTVAAIRSGKN